MWPFTCSVCKEKDARIADLKETISAQRLQLNPPPRINTYEMEENYLLQGGNEEQASPEVQTVTKEKAEELRAVAQEQELLLGGGYNE